MTQMDLFEWADSRPSNVIDALPVLVRRNCIKALSRRPPPSEGAKIIRLEGKAA